MIKSLSLSNVGPFKQMDLSFGSRLNVLTGDNGLGKSFFLDLIWFAMTREWPQSVNPTLMSGCFSQGRRLAFCTLNDTQKSFNWPMRREKFPEGLQKQLGKLTTTKRCNQRSFT